MYEERRRYERVAWFCPLHLTVLPNGPALECESFDISLGGVGIAGSVMLERGKSVRVLFHIRNGTKETIDEEVMGRVAYSRADEDGNRLGIEFLEPIKEAANPALAKKLNAL